MGYLGVVSGAEDTVEDLSDAVEETVIETAVEAEKPAPGHYTLTSKMNIRKTPSLNAEKAGIAQKGAVVEVAAIEGDWMRLTDGTFILYAAGKYAVKC